MEVDTGIKHNAESAECLKHPLEHSWDIWLVTNQHRDKRNQNQIQWNQNLVKLTTFDTVEDYWCLYHHMKLPSELVFGQDYCIFKDSVRPTWEEPANVNGGRWLIPLEKRKSEMDPYWCDIVLLLIGENFVNNDAINGVVVNVRAKSKINLWMADSSKEQENCEVAGKIKKHLGLHMKLCFQLHNSTTTLYSV